jgi:DNA-binding CsgD family transcriptional regulator/tetratricopeptide (TPR) repeat protein
LVDTLEAGVGGIVWIEAVAGGGKTFLLSHLAERYSNRADVRFASAARGTTTPYALALDLIGISARQLVGEGAPRSFLEAGVSNAADVIAIETLVLHVERQTQTGPAIWIVDDIHFADLGSLAWVEAIAALDPPPLLLMIAGRPPEPGSALAGCADSVRSRATMVHLDTLDPAEIAALCRSRFGGEPGPQLESVLKATEGSPLLVTALLEEVDPASVMLSAGRADVTVELAERLRVAVPTVVRTRLESVLGGNELVAVACALAGREFRAVDVAAVLGLPLHDVIGVVDRMERGGIVVAGTAHRFRHDHYRLAAIDMVSAPIRESLHAAYARLYIERGESALRVVDHLVESGSTGSDAAAWLTSAAEELVRFDPSSALRFAEQAVAISPDPSRRLTMVRARALGAIGRIAEAEALARALLVGATPEEEVVLRRDLAMVTFQQGGRAGDTVAELTRAVELATDERTRARLLAESSFAHLLTADFATARHVAAAGSADGERLGDLTTVLAAEMVGALVALYQVDLDEAERLAGRLETLSELPEAAEATVYQPWFAASLVHVLRDDTARARRLNAVGRARSSGSGYVWMVPAYDALDAFAALHLGDLDDVEASARGALSAGIEDSFGAALWCRTFLARTALARGDIDAARAEIALAEAMVLPGQAQLGWDHLALAQARLAEHAGQPEQALAHLDAVWEAFVAFGVRSARQELSIEIARLGRKLDDEEALTRAVADLAESAALARRPGWSLDHRCAVALCERDADELETVADQYARLGRRWRSAIVLASAALAAEARRRTSDARRLAGTAALALHGLGAAGDAAFVAHLAGGVPRPTTPRGLGRLSRSEREVVLLLSEGLTNAQIAERLFVSRRTVESHVSAAYRKLGTSNRVELARMVAAG